MKKLAIITTHPIQYNAPVFKMLAQRNSILIKVFYTWGASVLNNKFDPGFGTKVKWDIPLLDEYDYCFVNNISASPGSHHFNGIDNPTLNSEVEEWGATSILIFGWCFKSHLKALRYFKGKKQIIFRGDSNLLDEAPGFSIKKIMRRVFLKWVYGHVDKALYVGTANQQYYLKHGLKNSQLIFAPHAIDNDRFIKDANMGIRAELNIPPAAVVFVFAGKFETKKDPQLLLDAFSKLPGTNAHLLLVGNGELELQLKSSTCLLPLEISGRVHFLPFQNQLAMPSVYATGDVLVLPSSGPGETWGLSVNEAMASSRAVLVSDKCGCAANLVQEGFNGYVFKSRDDQDLQKKMERLMDHNEISVMGKRSLEIIQSWRFEKICEAIEQLVV